MDRIAELAAKTPRTWSGVEPGMVVKVTMRSASKPIGAPGDSFYSPGSEAGYIVIRVDYAGPVGYGWKVGGGSVVGKGYSNCGATGGRELWFPREFTCFEILDADQAARSGLA